MTWIVLVIGIAAACNGGGDDDGVVERQTPCMELREHVIGLRMHTASGSPEQLADMRAAFQRALGADFLQSCEKNLSGQQIDCSLQADDLNGVSTCAGSAPNAGKQP